MNPQTISETKKVWLLRGQNCCLKAR